MIAALSPWLELSGEICELAEGTVKVAGLSRVARLGDAVQLGTAESDGLGQVVRIDRDSILVKPFTSYSTALMGTRAIFRGPIGVAPNADWRGRALNALGHPVDQEGPIFAALREDPVSRHAPPPLSRRPVDQPMRTGVAAVDMFTPLCKGQRIGIFAAAGLGKTSLLMQLAKVPDAGQVVLCLVGERGREVGEIHKAALEATQNTAITIAATADESSLMRRLAAYTGMAAAEHFRDRGEDVLLIVDSITRFAQASREVALSAGEAPVARGFPPSVFNELPKLLERVSSSNSNSGSITGIFSVLVEGGDHNEPVSDCIRSVLDGHINLSKDIASLGRYPAIDILTSVSRVAERALSAETRKLAGVARALIARFEETRELRSIGAYQRGSDPELDRAVALVPRIYELISATAETASDPFPQLSEILGPS